MKAWRSWRTAAALALLAILSLGCRGPSITLEVRLPEDAEKLELTLTATLYAPGPQSEVTCEGVAYGDFTDSDLASSLVGSADLNLDGGDIGEVPRQGRKLVVVRAFDGDKQLRFAGCAEHDEDITAAVRIPVQLEVSFEIIGIGFDPNLDPPLADSLAAEITAGQTARASPDILLRVATVDGRVPPTTSPVRVRLVGPDGSYVNANTDGHFPVLLFDERGNARLSVTVDRAGPFAVELTPRYAPEPPGREIVRGFASPARREVTPFELDRLRWLVPLRLGADGAGFAGLQQDVGYRLSMAVARHDGNAPSFEVHHLDTGLLRPVGQVYLPAVDQAALVVQPMGIQVSRSRPELLVVRPGSGETIEQLTLTWTAQDDRELELVGTALPVGPCDGRSAPGADRDAPPLLVSILSSPTTSRTLRLLLADVDGNWSSDLLHSCPLGGAFAGVRSFCVADDEGEVHRLLELQGLVASDTVHHMLDLGRGIVASEVSGPASALCQRIQNAPSMDLETLQSFGPGRSANDEARLLSTSFAGLRLQLEVMRVGAPGQRVLVREEILVDSLPSPADLLHGGAFAAAGSRDLLSTFQLRGADGTTARSIVLNLLAEEGEWPEGELFGSMLLPPCRQLDSALGAVTQMCWVTVVDLDGDERDEVLLVVDKGHGTSSQFQPLLLNFGSP
ncbi:MAG: hypothetical protein ABIJ09_27570 [Pseudomonadota bacterium]